jgi:electron transfer flavoprotein beta subunit
MKILVCIKQVPDMESRFRVNSSGDWYDESDMAFRMNEYDEYAVEQAVLLKEQLRDTDITVISIGPDRVVETIRSALAMGCDRGIHVLDPASRTRDPWQIAAIIADFARDNGFDVIFTGMQSQDRGSAQVGVTVAELLGIPCVTAIVEFAYEDGVIGAKREMEGRMRGVVKVGIPAVFTCQTGLNVPRYPTLPNIMKAKKKDIVVTPVAGLLREQELTTTDGIHPPAAVESGIVLDGDVNEMAERLIAILKDKTAVLRGGRQK